MNWFFIAVIAQGILGSSAVFDKLLISRRSIDPFAYAFWLGILGVFALLLLPFGAVAIAFDAILWALLAGAFFVAAFFWLYWAMRESEVSAVFPLVGVLSPVFTLFFSNFTAGEELGFAYGVGFLFFIIAGAVLFFTEKRERRFFVICGGFVSALFFSGSVIISKIVFLRAEFIPGFFWIKIGGVIFALFLLLWPKTRKKIFLSAVKTETGIKFWYFANRAYAAAGSVLVNFAVFLAPNAALVDATQNLKFAAVFFLAWFLARERFYGKMLLWKLVSVFCIFLGFWWFAVGGYISALPAIRYGRPIIWGVTFSSKFAEQLSLDWRETYGAIMDELKPKKIRLIAYWDRIENYEGRFDFSELDFQLAWARAKNSEVVLALGMKTPRWPECHIPEWARDKNIAEREAKLRAYMRAVIERYKNNQEIKMWQVENEPYLLFGDCPEREDNFLEQEIYLVKSIDQSRPILVTDGGEFGIWIGAARKGDVFGATMYRKVYPKFIGPVFGTVEYPLGPEYFRLKEKITRVIAGDFKKEFIVIELQAEPWGHAEINKLSYQEQIELFSPEYFAETINYAKNTGFEEYYLWGAEWWYLLKNRQNDSRYFDLARALLNQN